MALLIAIRPLLREVTSFIVQETLRENPTI